MGEALSIWSPVVLAELSTPRSFDHHQVYHLDERFQSMEDLRVKLREYIVRKQGNALETLFKLEVLCLLENMDGKMQLVKKEENLRDRVLLQEFDCNLDFDKESRIDFIGDIKKINWQGGLDGNQLHVILFIDYILMAIRQQVIRLLEQEAELKSSDLRVEGLAQDETARMEEKNLELRRQLRFYEKNIASLKKGIKKVENRNAVLSRESQQYQLLIEELRRAIQEKEQRLSRYEARLYYEDNQDNVYEEIYSNNEGNERISGNSLGSRVKRLFLNSI